MKIGLLALLGLMACAAEPPPSAPVTPVLVAPQYPPPYYPPPQPMPSQQALPAPTLAGTIGGQPFVAQSALLVRLNQTVDSHSSVFPGQTFSTVWSFLLIFDRPIGCEQVGKDMLPMPGLSYDRYVKYQVQGRWPLPNGSTFNVGSDPQRPAADGFAGNVSRGQSGSYLRGTVHLSNSISNPAIIDMDVSTASTGTDTSGALRGTIAVSICQ